MSTLQPYDGAERVLLPDGRECWEKETKHYFGQEISRSYQYSVEIGDLSTDYNGRVCNLKVRAPDETWNEVVTFHPASPNLIAQARGVLRRGWDAFAWMPEDGISAHLYSDGAHLYSDGYLRICEDLIALLKSMEPKT